MTPQEQGRFCGSCQKIVVDFTLMTDAALLDYFAKASSHTCGRFFNDQLNRDLKPTAIKKRYAWAYVWNIVLATFLVTKTDAQVVKKKTPEVLLPDKAPITQGEIGTVEIKLPKTRELKGVVFDSSITRHPLAGASISVKDQSIGTVSDSLGNFGLMIEDDRPVDLIISYIGYTTQTVTIDGSTNWTNVKVNMSASDISDHIFSGGVVVVAYKKPKKKIVNDWKPAVLKKDIKIYPNPVVKGNTVRANLSLKQAGEYKLELMNMQGEVMSVQKLQMITKEQAVTIPTQSSWAPGIYVMRITAPGVKNVYQCKVSIQ
ncbi:hypothetical protein A4D02_29660 [Niastella koreensis]|nr:hypothetical protein A4D02_29660 [Niastella koreensis]